MSAKLISRPLVIFVILAHIFVLFACSGQKETVTGSAGKVGLGNLPPSDSYDPNDTGDDIPDISVSNDSTSVLDWTLELSNGMKLTINSYSLIGDSLMLNASYISESGCPVTRRLKISSLAGISIHNMSDQLLYSYEYSLVGENQVTLSTSTPNDNLMVEYLTTDSLVSIDYNFSGRQHHIEFDNRDELELAKALYLDIYVNDRHFDISPENQELVQRLVDLYNFLDVPSSFDDNPDVEAAGYLMNNVQFVEWCSRNFDWNTKECGRQCICDIASVLTLTCFLGLIGIVVCIPATGVAVACAVANLLSRIFS